MRSFVTSLVTMLVVFVAAVVGMAYFVQGRVDLSHPKTLLYYSPCDITIPYKIGTIDPEFGISQDELLEDVKQAADIWGQEYGKEIFVYNPQAQLTISMVYDKRQALNSQINQIEDKLTQDKNNIQPQIDQFEKDSADFKRRVDELNKNITYWNSQGGAPKDEYNRLRAEQDALQKEADRLNETARRLNVSKDQFNSTVSQLNQTVSDFNSALRERPEEGLYDALKNTIAIYLTNSNSELIHTLSHELGHAVGMDHVDGEESIMYSYTNTSTTPSEQDIAELKRTCMEQSVFEGFSKKLAIIIAQYKAKQAQQ